MSIQISNTLTGEKEPLETIEPGKVRMYVCGPTVYSDAHIGHAMSAIVFDVIKRYLQYRGYDVVHAQNFTDVDDKIIARAAALGLPPEQLAEQLIHEWLDQTAALNILPATVYPRATHEIDTIISIIKGLIEGGYAYPVEGGDVFYRVESFPGYGKLSHREIDEMQAGARIEVDERKEHPMDFALWKAAKPGEPAWNSPWGMGRPGWHIECSAMVLDHLGGQVDIHGGGADLIFPHHENEIAQSEAFCSCEPFARYWVHNGLLQLGGEKMSKSIGNLVTIRELLAEGNGDAFRMLVLGSHYRSPLTFNEDTLESAGRGLARLTGAVRGFNQDSVPVEPPNHVLVTAAREARARFERAMDDDFNTPVALAVLHDLARSINREQGSGAPPEVVAWAQAQLIELASLLGLVLTAEQPEHAVAVEPFIQLLLDVRQELRGRKEWALADTIRRQLEELGVRIEDTPEGSTWRLA